MKTEKYFCNICSRGINEDRELGLEHVVENSGSSYFKTCNNKSSDKHLCDFCIMALRKMFERQNDPKTNN